MAREMTHDEKTEMEKVTREIHAEAKKAARRCQYSEKGRQNLRPHHPERVGTIKNEYDGCMVTVLWDGLKHTRHFHRSYIEEIAGDPSTNEGGANCT